MGKSGTQLSYEERQQCDRVQRMFSLATETDEEITALATALKLTRSAVVSKAIDLLSHTVAPKRAEADE